MYIKKIILPVLELTEVATGTDPDAIAITLPTSEICDSYFVKPKYIGINGIQRYGSQQWNKCQYNFFPVVLDRHGVPWAEAVVYILSRLEGVTDPAMASYISIADDLSSYRHFLDDTGLDWTHFPTQKLARPTYRFNGHLKHAVAAGEMAVTSAQRQMGTVINFYRYFKEEGLLVPDNLPWRESDRYISFKDSHGFERSKKVVTTDVSIKVPKQNDLYDECIDDGGKLRPLPQEEQEWLIDALLALRNTEMTIIHLFGILTGARIQTILTFQVRHVMDELAVNPNGDVRIPIGGGTGIDTKKNKKMVLHLPSWFYEMLRTYVNSNRAKKRREMSSGGNNEKQYLFLSVRGVPLYKSKADKSIFDENNKLRHDKSGQGVRQFITERIIPYIREKHNQKDFHYQFHDLRATAGMNWTDQQLKLVEHGKISLHEAREFVKTRMGHESATTTDRYLQYRRNLKIVNWAGQGYENHIRRLSDLAMYGLK